MESLFKLLFVLIKLVFQIAWVLLKVAVPVLGKIEEAVLANRTPEIEEEDEEFFEELDELEDEDLPTPEELGLLVEALRTRIERVKRIMTAPVVAHLRVHLHDCIELPLSQLERDLQAYERQHDEERALLLLVVTEELSELDTMCGYLERVALQRQTEDLSWLGDSDAFAEACYRPVLDFAKAQDLALHTMHPMTVSDRWGLAIDLSFEDSKLAPLLVPSAFAHDVFWWPAVAHEIGHDFFHSVDGLKASLFERLGLPEHIILPTAPRFWNNQITETMMGAWVEEFFCDVVGTLTMGPAFVASMTHLFAEPDNSANVWACNNNNGLLDEHPPRHLRVLLCCEVLDWLGHHHAAKDYLQEWLSTHQNTGGYFLPCQNGEWVQYPADTLEKRGRAVVRTFLEDHWDGLEGYHLVDIPGFTYLHAEHAKTVGYAKKLAQGHTIRGDKRLLVAAAVLATRSHPELAEAIFAALKWSVVGLGTGERNWELHADVPGAAAPRTLVEDLRDPWAVAEAMVLGAALAPRRPALSAWRPGLATPHLPNGR